RTHLLRFAILAFVLSLLAGCGLDGANPMSPAAHLRARAVTPQARASEARGTIDAEAGDHAGPQGGPGFFPLALGNHWEYVTGFAGIATDDETGQTLTFSDPGTMTADLTSIHTLNGRDYVGEIQVFGSTGIPHPTILHIDYRQDGAGL